MSRWVLGKHWREASEGQRVRFVEEFRSLLVRTYATALLEYSNQAVEVLPVRAAPDATDVVVRTEVRQPGAPPIPIQYSMNLEQGDWKVYDVTIDGISLVASYRSTFNAEASRGGLDRVIALLVERNQGATR
jgi:phospholipid transport system substrate-binding protein